MQTLMRSLVTLLALMLVACSADQVATNGSQGPSAGLDPGTEQPGVTTAFPALGDMPRLSSDASGTFRLGREYLENLPSQNVYAVGDAGFFHPSGQSPAEAAYAIYAFDLTGQSGEKYLFLEPQERFEGFPTGHAWIGIADWTNLSWSWHSITDNAYLRLESIEPFIRPGDNTCYVIMLFRFDGATELGSLRIDNSPQLEPAVTAVQPLVLQTGSSATFVAEVTGHKPYTYQWDFSGATEPGTSSEPSPQVLAIADGLYECNLTVSNEFGSVAFPFNVSVSTEPVNWVHTYGTPLSNAPISCDTDSEGDLYYLDYHPVSVGNPKVWKLTPQGDVVWAYQYSHTAFEDYVITPRQIAVDDSGNTYMLSQFDIPGAGTASMTPALVKLDPTGNPVWMKYFESSTYITGSDIAVNSLGEVYLCGQVIKEEYLYYVALLKFAPDGSLLSRQHWGQSTGGKAIAVACDDADNVYVLTELWGEGGGNCLSKLSYDGTPQGNVSTGHSAAGMVIDSVGGTIYLYTRFAGTPMVVSAFDLNLQRQWIQRFSAILLNYNTASLDSNGALVLGGSIQVEDECFLQLIQPDGQTSWCRKWSWDVEPIDRTYFFSMAKAPAGDLYLCTYSRSAAGSWQDCTPAVTSFEWPVDSVPANVFTFSADHQPLDGTCVRSDIEYVIDEASHPSVANHITRYTP